MVTYEERTFKKSDQFFVHEDAARLYRGLKDLLVDEFDIDRIEEGHMEFNVEKPKDRIRMHAFKEKDMHSVIYINVNFKSKAPRDIYKWDRDDDILKARVKTSASVITTYPGAEPINWLPRTVKSYPNRKITHSGLEAEHTKAYHHSKLYKFFAGLWYNKLHAKEIEAYEEESAEICKRLHNLMRERYGVEDAIARTGASEYEPPWQGP